MVDIKKLIEQLEQVLNPEEAEQAIIFGSAAIVLQGVSLGRPVNDLDVFVSESTFKGLGLRHAVRHKPATDSGDQVPYIEPVPGAEIEILRSFPGVNFEEVAMRSVAWPGSSALRIGSLEDLCSWKTAQHRPKDLPDIEAIERFLNPKSSS